MKRSLLFVFTALLVGNIQAQFNQPCVSHHIVEDRGSQTHFSPKAAGQVVWDNEFDNFSEWTIGAPDIQGEWELVTSTPAQLDQYMGAMQSSTAANGFGAFNGVQYLLSGPVNAQNATLTFDGSIDLSTENDILFIFEQRYRAFNSDETWVEFSTDGGTTWSGVQVNQNVVTNDPAVQNVVSVNASSFVGGENNVTFRFRWTNSSDDDQFGSGYGWMVDDVRFQTLPDNDITSENLYFGSQGLPYFIIPEAQVTAIDFSITAFNTGINTQYGVQLQATESGASYNETSPASTILAGDSAELIVAPSFTPPSAGNYTVEFEILNDSIDDDPSNNVLLNYSFSVGGDVYARDQGTAQGAYSVGEPLEGGNMFDIFTNQNLTGIDVRFGNDLGLGVQVNGIIYEVTPDGEFEYIAETNTWTSGANDAASLQTLVFPSAVPLEAGKTYLATASSSFNEFSIATSGSSVIGTTFLYGDLGSAGIEWYWAPSTVMVRMNFDPTLSTTEVFESNFDLLLYPNPAADYTTLEFELLNDTKMSLEISDVTGKVVYSEALSNLSKGKHSINIDTQTFSEGVYFLNVRTGNNVTSKKLVIK